MKHLFIVVIIMVLAGCKADKLSNTSTEDSVNEQANAPNGSIKPYQVFLVNVDKLRLRDAPGGNSKTLANLPEYDIVYARGAVSKLIDTINLRNYQHIAPYFKVSSSQGDGWLFGGALTKLYEGDIEVKAPSSLGQLAKDLKKESKTSVTIGSWMANRISNEDMSDPKVNDMYMALAVDVLSYKNLSSDSDLYAEIEDGQGFSDDDYGAIFDRSFDPSTNAYAQKAYNSGFVLNVGEGMFWPELSLSRFGEILGGPFTESMEAYMEVDKMIYENPYQTDAAIFAEKEVIARLIDKCVQFRDQYPNSLYREKNDEMIEWMLADLMYGSSNTPAFDWETREMYPEWKSDLLDIIKKYKDSTWTVELVAFKHKMDQNGWKRPN